MKLYEFAILLNEKRDKDGDITDPARILVMPKTVLARDENQATILAAREIPDTVVEDKLDRVEVAVRPF